MNIVYATGTTSVTAPDGSSVTVRHGQHWSAEDPIVRAHPGLFSDNPCYGLTFTGEPPVEMSQPPVESATAAPGERRNVRRVGA